MNIPNDLRLVNATEKSSAIRSRSNLTINPQGDSTLDSGRGSNSSGQILFRLPIMRNRSYDMMTFFLHFNFRIVLQEGVTKTTATNQTRIFLHDSIESIFSSVRVLCNSQELEYISQYNALESAFSAYCSRDFVAGFGSPCMKMGLHSSVRNNIYHAFQNATTLTAASETTNSFSCGLRLTGTSSPNFVLPSELFSGSSFLEIEINLESPNNCIVAYEYGYTVAGSTITQTTADTVLGGVSNLFYQLSDIRATVDVIEFSNEYSNMVSNAIASSKLVYPISTFNMNRRTLNTNITRFTDTISVNYSSINAVFAWFYRTSELSSHLFAGFDRTVFPTNLKSASIRVNNIQYPLTRPYNCQNGATEVYCGLISALNVLKTVEQYGGLNYDPINFIQFANTASNAENIILGSYSTGDLFYGKNRDSSYGVPRSLTSTSNETFSPNQINVGYTIPSTCTGQLQPYAREMAQSKFMLGWNLRTSIDVDPGNVVGENLSQSGQIQFDFDFSSATSESYVMYVAIYHDRFIELSSQNVYVKT